MVCDKVRVFPIATGRKWQLRPTTGSTTRIELGVDCRTAGYEERLERAAGRSAQRLVMIPPMVNSS